MLQSSNLPYAFPLSHGSKPYRLIEVLLDFIAIKTSVYIIVIIYEAFYYIIILKTFILEQIHLPYSGLHSIVILDMATTAG